MSILMRVLNNKMFHVVHWPKPTELQAILTFVHSNLCPSTASHYETSECVMRLLLVLKITEHWERRKCCRMVTWDRNCSFLQHDTVLAEKKTCNKEKSRTTTASAEIQSQQNLKKKPKSNQMMGSLSFQCYFRHQDWPNWFAIFWCQMNHLT